MLNTDSCQKASKPLVICLPYTDKASNQNKWAPQQWGNKAHGLKTKQIFTIHLQREKRYLMRY